MGLAVPTPTLLPLPVRLGAGAAGSAGEPQEKATGVSHAGHRRRWLREERRLIVVTGPGPSAPTEGLPSMATAPPSRWRPLRRRVETTRLCTGHRYGILERHRQSQCELISEPVRESGSLAGGGQERFRISYPDPEPDRHQEVLHPSTFALVVEKRHMSEPGTPGRGRPMTSP